MGTDGISKRILANHCRDNNIDNCIIKIAFRCGDFERQGKESF